MSKIYTKQDKQKVVAHYVVTGNVSAVAKATNIPRTTINSWLQTEWWNNLVTAAHIEHDKKLDVIMTQNIEQAGLQLQDRVRNGDFRLNKKDELVRVPMGGKDLSIVGGVTFDKRSLLRGRPTSIQRTDDNQRLEKLMIHFESIVNHKVIEGEMVKD